MGLSSMKPLPVEILIVDDSEEEQQVLAALLREPDCAFVCVRSGEEALAQLRARDFALVLMDLHLPGMSGLETLRAIQLMGPIFHAPVIFISGDARAAESVRAAYELGAADFLTKPVEPAALRAKVAVFVELFRKTEQLEQHALLLHRLERLDQERRLAEVREASEARFRSLVDRMPVIAWIAGPEGEIRFWNQTWSSYTGQSPEQAREGWDQAIHPADLSTFRVRWEEAVRSATPLEAELRIQRGAAPAEYRWHLCRVQPERGENGSVIGWIGTATDIEDQKQLQQAQEELLLSEQLGRANAEAASQAKDEFLATVSHELRTPLTAILGWVRILGSKTLSPERRERALEVIRRNAEAQAQLVEDILDVSRITTGKLKLARRPLRLVEAVEAAVETIRQAAENKGVALEARLGSGGEVVLGDRARLQQIFLNLLSNAVKFTPPGGRISVRLHGQPHEATVEVADTGVGMSGDFLPRAFDPFMQEERGNTRRHGGLGLGLAIVQHLVEAHGGRITAQSQPGEGTAFRITLPLAERLHGVLSLDGLDLDEAPPRLDGIRVMLVEDDPDSREVLTQQLQELGAEVTAVASAQAAFELLHHEQPDVILSDIAMNGEDGYSLVRRIRALRPEEGGRVPAAALTALTGTQDQEQAYRSGFQAHLAKPASAQDLAGVVARLAGRMPGGAV